MNSASPSATILIVDDDRGLLRLVEKSLRREGFSVKTADSGAAAISILKEFQPDIALFDLKLQDIEANELIQKLAALNCLPPFIIITGQGDERVAVEMMKRGALDYVVKDAQFQAVLPNAIRRVLKQIEKEKKLAAAEQSLRLSEERFRVALKNSPIIVFNQDADLRYTWVHNMPMSDSEKKVMGKTDEELYSQEEADRLTQIKTRVLITGTALRSEVQISFAGERFVYDLTVEPVRNELGQIAGITGAAMDITEHKRLEKEVLQISEMEQRRIGQDLHDGICQHLAGIELMSEVLEQNLGKKSNAQAAQAGKIATHVRDVIGQTRSLARGLSPVVLEAEGLMAALTELAANTGKMFGVKCDFAFEAPVFIEDLITSTHLFRIAQEAVTNAIKHGKAKQIKISLATTDDQLVLTIADNGAGFETQSANTKGMGLRIMQYRAGMIGGTLLVRRQTAGGTAVICFLSKPKNTGSKITDENEK